MLLDKEDHRQMLLELIDKSAFPGAMRKVVVELADAIEFAGVKDQDASKAIRRVR